jgi:hypothetical protein
LSRIHDEKTIGWRIAFKEGYRAFDSPNPADKRSNQQGNDADMGDDKREVMFAPGPA